ncbi:Helicase associated domain protein [Streptomyces albogriseolus]|uniref:DEAD/DEAH box helicase n=1 Tax=Streptomyces albogriseolus TaxID=1887 RepID=UPI0036E738ED
MELRPYQQEAVTAVAAGLRDGGLGQLHAACGSGKTLMGQQAALRILPGGGLVAVLVPSLALVSQTIASWRALHPAGSELHVLAVCSDDTVTDAPVHLPDLHSPVTTNPATIARWLRSPVSGTRLIVSTYMSADRLHEALGVMGMRLDLLILDEAHHLTGRVEIPIRRMTEQSFLPSLRRLYMTATPRMDRTAADHGGTVSMDNTSVFGPVLYSYPFSRGIAEGYLEDYRLFVIGVRESEARAMLSDPAYDYVGGVGAPSLSTLVAQAALVRAAQKYGTRRAVTFHHRVERAAEFARTLPGLSRRLAPDLPVPVTAHVHGAMEHAIREKVLADLRHPPEDGWAVVSNARCLSEGVDVPAIDAVLFAHPKSSAVDIVQAVGRALRPHPDTPGLSTVIVPIVVPEEDGEIGDLEPGDYATLWHVVRALRAHDEPLGIALDENRANVHVEAPRLPSKMTMVLPPGTAQGILSQVELMLVRQTTSPWWEGYGAALQYRSAHGHLNIPLRHRTSDGFQLGQWLVKQRQHYRKGWLPADRVAALEKLGIVWDPGDARWMAAYQLAAAWYAEHGHLDIPYSRAGGVRDPLGEWIVRQRQYRRADALSEERIRRLDAIGMIWEVRDRAWQEKLDALADYQRQHGDTLVPQRYEHEGVRLGAWVSQMRAKYTAGKLPAQRVRELEQAGMAWRVDEHPQNRRALAAAADWVRIHGTLEMPHDTRHQGVGLGSWLSRQRRLYAAGELPAYIAEPLTQLGMRWEPTPRKVPAPSRGGQAQAEASWQRGYPAAVAFFREHGHLRVPQGYRADGMRLDAWLGRQRAAYRNGRLPAERVEALSRLGIRWGVAAPRTSGSAGENVTDVPRP